MDDLKLSTAVCGIDCFNCELYYTNIDSFFEKMAEDRKTAIGARGMTKGKLICTGCRISGCSLMLLAMGAHSDMRLGSQSDPFSLSAQVPAAHLLP